MDGARAAIAAVDVVLEKYRSGDGFTLYTDLTQADIKEMSDALGESVSQVAEVVATR